MKYIDAWCGEGVHDLLTQYVAIFLERRPPVDLPTEDLYTPCPLLPRMHHIPFTLYLRRILWPRHVHRVGDALATGCAI